LIGRDAERAELIRGLENALAGHGSIVLVGGEPGIGKTRLTQELLADARERGFFGLVGHSYEGEGAAPYVPFVETLEYTARVVPPAAFRRALGDAAPEVAKLMPELRRLFADIPPPIELPPEQQRRFLFNAYLEFTQRSCAITPLAVVLEDLHWADEPTLQLLQHLAQAIPTERFFVVGTYRDVELDVTRPFARTLETLLRERLASRISLRRLGASGVESMLHSLSGQPPPASLSRVLFAETEGNPFFVEEVFQHLSEEGQLFDADGKWRSDLRFDSLRVPESVRLVVGRRFERLGERTRRVLTTASIMGRTFSLALLEALEASGPDEVVDALEEAERAQLVVAEPAGREARFRFAHELIRQTLAEALSLPRRQRLHARVAEAIERVYGPGFEKHAPALAHHLYQAGAAADAEKTSVYLLLASDQARVAAAHEDSLAHLDNALSLWQGEVSARVADIHSRRAVALRSLGRVKEAVEAFESAISLFRSAGDFDRMVANAIDLGWVKAWNADFEAVLGLVQRAFEEVQGMPPKLACRLQLLRAVSLTNTGDLDQGFTMFAEARKIQQLLDEPDLSRECAHTETFLCWESMQLQRAVEIRREMVRRSRAAGHLWSELDSAYMEPFFNLYCGRPTEAARLVEEGSLLAERIGHQSIVWVFKIARTIETVCRGDLDTADRLAADCLLFSRTTAGGWRFLSETLSGEVAFLRGRTGEALAHLREATEIEPRTYWSGFSASSLLWALAHEGSGAAEAMLNDTRWQLPDRGRIPKFGDWFALAAVVEALALIGRREKAAGLLESAEDFVATGVQYLRCQMSSTVAGIAAACAREWSRAEEHHRLAVRQADAAYAVSRPHARFWYADMLLARDAHGDRARARTLLSEALSLYESLGMPGFARRTSARLAADA
jgi:tetratricopeptide (TPR) repeat protein